MKHRIKLAPLSLDGNETVLINLPAAAELSDAMPANMAGVPPKAELIAHLLSITVIAGALCGAGENHFTRSAFAAILKVLIDRKVLDGAVTSVH